MKKTFLVFLLAAVSCLNAQAQGKLILGNDSAHLFVLGTTLPADAGLGGGVVTVGNTTGAIPVSPLPSGVTLAVALFVGTSPGSLSLQTSLPLTGLNWLSPGRMADKTVTPLLPGGSLAYFNIVIYDSAYSPSPGSSYYGESGIFSATVPAMGSTRLDSYWPEGNLVINIPEPSAIALAGLGAVTLLIRHRRK